MAALIANAHKALICQGLGSRRSDGMFQAKARKHG
jgi:hypothetical protein